MLYVVNEFGNILFKVDAWHPDCMDLARQFIRDCGYKVVDQKVTFMGDMVVEVEFR